MNTMSGEGAVAPSTSTRRTAVYEEDCGGRESTQQALVRLEQNDPSVTSCRVVARFYLRGVSPNGIYIHPRTEEDWRRLGDALATNTHLRRLELIDLDKLSRTYQDRGWEVDQWLREFYPKLCRNRSIRRLGLNNVDLYGGDIFTPDYILPLLENNPSLTSLAFSRYNPRKEASQYNYETRQYNLDRWHASPEHPTLALSNMAGSLEVLDLSESRITTNMCQSLLAAFHVHSSTLRSLDMNGNDIRCGGCIAITALLGSPDSALAKLYLDNNGIADEGVEALADALATNDRLKVLTLHANPAITPSGYDALLKTICNGPKVDDIVRSNHTLQQLGAKADRLPEESKLSLSLNRATCKSHVARRKVVMHNLVYNCNIELLDEIPWSFVPDVLAMIADDDSNQQIKVATNRSLRQLALYRILRRCPSICKVHAQGRAGCGGEQMLPMDEMAIKRMRFS